MIRKSVFAVSMLALLALAVPAVDAAPAAVAAKNALSLPLTGSFTDALGQTGQFTGHFKLVQFAVEGDGIVGRGFVVGNLVDSTGRSLGSVTKSASMPLQLPNRSVARRASRLETNATCPILHLVLGPLDLDLLGLTVNLNQVVLDIAAETGAGNLLGNLLCAVTGLLDGVGALIDIVQLLNQILDILSGLLG